MRSADTLAALIIEAHKNGRDIGNPQLLQRYQLRHRLTSKPIYEATNAIVKLYTNDHPLAKLARNAALRLGNNFPPLKQLVDRQLARGA